MVRYSRFLSYLVVGEGLGGAQLIIGLLRLHGLPCSTTSDERVMHGMIDGKLMVRLRRSPGDVATLAKDLGVARSEVVNALARLEQSGRAKRTASGWCDPAAPQHKTMRAASNQPGKGKPKVSSRTASQPKRTPAPPLSDATLSQLDQLLEAALQYGQTSVVMASKGSANHIKRSLDLNVTPAQMHAVMEHGAEAGRLRRVGTKWYCLPHLYGKALKAWNSTSSPQPKRKSAPKKPKKVSDSDWQSGPWHWRYERPSGFHH